MKKPLPYTTLLSQTKERLEAAKKRLDAKPEDPVCQDNVQWLTAEVTKLERYAAQEVK